MSRARPWLTAGLIAALILFAWTGYTESDDEAYAKAAMRWIADFPFLGTDHHALRHAIVLPTAFFFWLHGPSEPALVLPILLYLTGLLLLTYLAVCAVAGPLAGSFALLLTGTIPALVLGATLSVTDIPEALFVLGSVWSFFFACRDRRRWLFVLSGVLAGMGFITRETSAAVLVLYGILFLWGYGGSRLSYVWMGLGFVAVAGLDFVSLWVASGDPLYRFHISLEGVAADSPLAQEKFRSQAAPGVDRFGALAVARTWKPLAVVFLNQQFGLLAWFAVPAAAIMARTPQASTARAICRLLGAAAMVWFVVLFYGLSNYLNIIARYVDVTAIALVVPLSVLLAGWWSQGRRWAAGACLGSIVAVNVLLIASADTRPLFGERALVAMARMTREPILTDPGTFKGALLLLWWEDLADRVIPSLPAPGRLYLYDSHPRRGFPADWPARQPEASWQEQARQDKPAKPLAFVARALGARRYLPSGVADKLDPPPSYVGLYRVPSGGRE